MTFREIRTKCIGIGGKPLIETKSRKVTLHAGKKTVVIIRELYMEDGIAIIAGKRTGDKGYTVLYIGPYLGYEGSPGTDDGENPQPESGQREAYRKPRPCNFVSGTG